MHKENGDRWTQRRFDAAKPVLREYANRLKAEKARRSEKPTAAKAAERSTSKKSASKAGARRPPAPPKASIARVPFAEPQPAVVHLSTLDAE